MLPFRFYVSIETNLKRGCRWEFYSPIICKGEYCSGAIFSLYLFGEYCFDAMFSFYLYGEYFGAKKIWPVGENDC
jgi:hypothetical protein